MNWMNISLDNNSLKQHVEQNIDWCSMSLYGIIFGRSNEQSQYDAKSLPMPENSKDYLII